MELKLEKLIELESFRIRTPMYIGDNKISNLKSFIDGYYYALDAIKVEYQYILEGFNDWVAKYYGWSESTAGWKNIISKECNKNEQKSVHTFFELYDKFKLEKID